MIDSIANILNFAVQTADQQEKVNRKIRETPMWDKIVWAIETGDFNVVTAIIGIVLLFVTAIFIVLIIRRLPNIRWAYFFLTVLAIGERLQNNTDLFWSVVPLASGIFFLGLFVFAVMHVEFDAKKEPIFYLLNSFAMFLIIFPIGYPIDPYRMIISAVALITSMFFIVSKKHIPQGHFQKNSADDAIMNALEKKQKSNTL